jgi:hypothetical protein
MITVTASASRVVVFTGRSALLVDACGEKLRPLARIEIVQGQSMKR